MEGNGGKREGANRRVRGGLRGKRECEQHRSLRVLPQTPLFARPSACRGEALVETSSVGVSLPLRTGAYTQM